MEGFHWPIASRGAPKYTRSLVSHSVSRAHACTRKIHSMKKSAAKTLHRTSSFEALDECELKLIVNANQIIEIPATISGVHHAR